jgi:hypothetical protein
MKYEDFEILIKEMQNVYERSFKLYSIGLDAMDYNDHFYKIINILLKNTFDEQGCDWIDWFLYERQTIPNKPPLKAYDENKKEICYDIESLWEVVKEHLKYEKK